MSWAITENQLKCCFSKNLTGDVAKNTKKFTEMQVLTKSRHPKIWDITLRKRT